MGVSILVRCLGLSLVLDGAYSALSGSGWVSRVLWALATPGCCGKTHSAQPQSRRALGVAEMLAGAWLLGRVPFRAAGLYRVIGRNYDSISLVWQRWLFRDAQAAIEDGLTRWLPPNGRVLDLGCGTAANLDRLVSLRLPYGSYTGVDFSESMLAEASRKFGHLPNVAFHRSDLASGPLPKGEYDLIVSTWALSHIPERERVIEKAWDRLKPGGHMVLVDVSRPGTQLYPLLRPLVHFVAVKPLTGEFEGRLPGEKTVRRLSGGWTTVIVSRKPS